MSIRTGRLVVAAAAVAALAVAVLPTSALATRDSSRITGVVTANDEPVRAGDGHAPRGGSDYGHGHGRRHR